eukprot:6382415-Amphidinium_carterae.1
MTPNQQVGIFCVCAPSFTVPLAVLEPGNCMPHLGMHLPVLLNPVCWIHVPAHWQVPVHLRMHSELILRKYTVPQVFTA